MEITCAGAARTVTGSCHHVRLDGTEFLLDCGLFQGGHEAEADNRAEFPFEPAGVDAVLVSHGHLDHVGRLPLLVERGYRGPIYATGATRNIAEVILRDAAKLQEEDHRRELRRATRAGREDEVLPPLYHDADVDRTMELFRTIDMDTPVSLPGGARARFRPAGHVLGSATIELDHGGTRLLFSGDLGNRESALQAPAELPQACDLVLVETTYAERNHRSREATEQEFGSVLASSLGTGGNVLIPTFALERSQAVLYEIRRLMERGAIPRVRVFLDSPMATRLTRFYEHGKNEFRDEVKEVLAEGRDPFAPPTLEFTVDTEASKAINAVEGGAIILAGSGMMTGGRILHHLKHNLWRADASVVVVGYQASGTLGRALVSGAERVRIFGDEIRVRAGIHTINGFSAHADHDDLRRWLDATGDAEAFLVHGEPDAMDAFAAELRAAGRRVTTPEPGNRYRR
ncbi:MAG TPA: MBL fold metallo-hydrolase [Trueperaceae bacterium]|nr:MBL fold metallo-hydrolase [Trueperaceae bacterium]